MIRENGIDNNVIFKLLIVRFIINIYCGVCIFEFLYIIMMFIVFVVMVINIINIKDEV